MNLKQHIKKLGGFDKLPENKKELAEKLLAFEEKYNGKSVICTEYQLGRDENGFSIEMKKLRRNNTLTECSFFVQINFDTVTNGRLFVIDEEKTAKHITALQKHKEKQIEKQELEAEVGEEVANAIKTIGKSAKIKVEKNK
jgi:hypothetical protein